jgi:hypothetical protein
LTAKSQRFLAAPKPPGRSVKFVGRDLGHVANRAAGDARRFDEHVAAGPLLDVAGEVVDDVELIDVGGTHHGLGAVTVDR